MNPITEQPSDWNAIAATIAATVADALEYAKDAEQNRIRKRKKDARFGAKVGSAE